METIVSTIPVGSDYRTPGTARPDSPAAVIDLRGIVEIARRRIGLIVSTGAFFAAAALVYVLVTPTRYVATTQLLLDPNGLQIVGNDLTPRSGQSDISLAEIESQLKVAVSEVVLANVVERERLAGDPEFGKAGDGWLTKLATLVLPQPMDNDFRLKALRILQQRLEARRPEKTLILDLSVWTEDRVKSARIANALAQAYLEQESTARADAALRTNASLVARLGELRQRLQESDNRVDQYKTENKLISSGGQLVNEQQLTEMNKRLVLARERTAQQVARYEEIERLRRSNASPDAFSELTDSATFIALRTKYAEAKQAEANALATMGPRHPAMMAAAAQVETSRKLVDEEIARIARSALSDLNRSRANEESIESGLEALKTLASDTNAAQVKLRELERQAEADRAVYVAFLNRAKEVSEQRSLEKSNARVITHALPPPGKSNPSRVLVLAASLCIGLIGGLGLALLREQFDPSLYSADQITDEIGLRVLAVLPRPPARWSSWLGRREAKTELRTLASCDQSTPTPVRRLRDGLLDSIPMNETRLVLVTSPDDLESRSVVATDLALTAAADGERVLLIDADRRQRRLTTSLTEAGAAGLHEVLAGQIVLSRAVVKTPWQRVDLLTAGPVSGNPRQFRQLPREAISGQLRAFDLVVVDGRLPSSDHLARNFSSLVDDVVIVVEAGVSRKDELRHMLQALSSAKMNVRGAVLVGAVG
jgi:polysaccharide biosynthesis transport protein